MGKGYKHGGSGGTALNFNVKTYLSETELKADKPRENTIGVITTTTMTSWAFSAKEPAEPEVGMVWISVGTTSPVEFNALKSKTLQVYPINAKQYVGGKWEDIVAYSYPDDEWVEWWDGYYYRSGNEYKNITGGWVVKEKKGTQNGTLGTLTKQEDGLVINLTGNNCGACLRTEEMVDLTDIQKINIAWVIDSGSISGGSFFVTDSISVGDWDWNNRAVTSGDVLNMSSVEIDVSALQGEFYVCMAIDYAHGTMATDTKFRVTEVDPK